jgi:DNA-binding MarR family transcriptional regulator
MLKHTQPPPAPAKEGPNQADIGALLRVNYQVVRERQLVALIDEGFADLNEAFLSVLLCPGLDRLRPSDLAARTNTTKQAMNYLLGQLEALGYIERRTAAGNGRRFVFLTKRGWRARETIQKAAEDVAAEWVAILGQRRFRQFVETLRQLSVADKAS